MSIALEGNVSSCETLILLKIKTAVMDLDFNSKRWFATPELVLTVVGANELELKEKLYAILQEQLGKIQVVAPVAMIG